MRGRAASRPLRVLLYGLNYKPELIGIGKYSGELAEGLAALGHEIRVVAAFPYYPQWKMSRIGKGIYGKKVEVGIEVIRCPLYVPRSPSGLKRVLHLASFALASGPVAVMAALRQRPDIVLAVMPTLAAAPFALLAARLSGARSWIHVQDLEIDAAFQTGLLKNPLAARAALAVERVLLRCFSTVSTISSEMRHRLHAKLRPGEPSGERAAAAGEGEADASDANPVLLLPNWVDTAEIFPMEDAAAARAQFDIPPQAFVALYAGNMNSKQGLQILPELAERLADEPRAMLVLAGDGPMRPELEAAMSGWSNVRFLPLQPFERFNALLNAADVHLLPQRPEASGLVLPSKLAPMLASGRPVIAVALAGSALEAAAEGCGPVSSTLSAATFETGIRQLLGDEALRARYSETARQRALQEWGKEGILSRFAAALEAAAGQGGK